MVQHLPIATLNDLTDDLMQQAIGSTSERVIFIETECGCSEHHVAFSPQNYLVHDTVPCASCNGSAIVKSIMRRWWPVSSEEYPGDKFESGNKEVK